MPPITPSRRTAPPEPEADKDDAESAGRDHERAQLKARLLELIESLKRRPESPGDSPSAKPGAALAIAAAKPVDQIRVILNLFRAGEVQNTLQAIKQTDSGAFSTKDSMLVKYIKASCLRRLGELALAKTLYIEISTYKDDAFLAESAAWQLQAIKWRESLDGQVDTTDKPAGSK